MHGSSRHAPGRNQHFSDRNRIVMTLWNKKVLVAVGAALVLCGVLAADDPAFRYGAVYFRKSNPPEQDWARDHKTAADNGVNTFRHWFMWRSEERRVGKECRSR